MNGSNVKVSYWITPEADHDIDEILAYLTNEAGIEKALQFLTEVQETFQLISSPPEIGWKYETDNPRLFNIRAFRVSPVFDHYLVFYRKINHTIELIRILHGSRDIHEMLKQVPATS